MDEDNQKDPIDFMMQCAFEYGHEYLISRPDLKGKILAAGVEVAVLRNKAWKYDELTR